MSLSDLAKRCEPFAALSKADLALARAELVRDAKLLASAVANAVADPAEWLAFSEVYASVIGRELKKFLVEQIEAARAAKAAAEERAAKAAGAIERDAFDAAGDPETLDQMQWGRPRKDGTVPLLRNDYNLGVILRNDPMWRGRLRFNEFRNEEEIQGEPGRECDPNASWRPLADVDDINLCRWVSEVYRLDYRPKTAQEQVMSVASENRVHPVRDYLRSLRWDGKARLSEFLFKCFGVVADNAAERATFIAVGRAWLVSMVARVMDPGCKVDTVPVLRGEQGAMKSKTLRAMMPDETWFFDSDLDLRSKDKYQILPGRWLLELAEFDRFSGKADAAEIKAYVTSSTDTYRGSYARRVGQVKRQCVFCATVNAPQFLTDATGARRFWTMECGACDPKAMAEMRDQLWAEAFHVQQRGENWWLSKEDAKVMNEQAEAFRISDPWEARVEAWALGKLVDITASDVLVECLAFDVKDAGKAEQMRVTAILHRLGWTRHKGRGQTTWKRPPAKPVSATPQEGQTRKRTVEESLREPAPNFDDGPHL